MPKPEKIFLTRTCSTMHGSYQPSSRPPQTWHDYNLKNIPHARFEKRIGTSDKMVTNNEPESEFSISIPNEVMENIVRYFDGRTMLKFKMLSKLCRGIVYNTIKTNNGLWKNICFNEVPEKDLDMLFENKYNNTVDIDMLSEYQYEQLYRQWIHWKADNFNVKFMCQKNFMSSNSILRIFCHKSKIVVVFPNYTCVFSVLVADKIKQFYRENGDESMTTENEYAGYPKSIVILNRRQNYLHLHTYEEGSIERTCPGFKDCPFNNINRGCNGINCRIPIPHELITLTPDYTISLCCWIKEYCSAQTDSHYCNMDIGDTFEYILYSSILDGIVIDKMFDNCVQIHKISQKTCYTICPWLEEKYIEPTAIYIYFDILFVGTRNGYLLAYRLRSWSDLFNINEKNLLLETQFNIGKIMSIDIMNTEFIKGIAVASASSVAWIKIN